MKVFFAITVFALVALASGRQVAPEDPIGDMACGMMEAMWENNKGQLQELNVERIDLGLHGIIRHLNVSGLNKAILDSTCNGWSVEMVASLDESSVIAELEDINAVVANVPIWGSGEASGSADRPRLSVTFKVKLDTDKLKINVEDLMFSWIRVEFISAKLTGVDNSDQVTKDLNANLAPWVNEQCLTGVLQEHKQLFEDWVNQWLDGLALGGSEA